MPDTAKDNNLLIVEEYRQALCECEDLYRTSGLECARYHPDLIEVSPAEFVERMLDLYRGLMIKIFIEIAFADRHWSLAELRLAGELFEQIWGKRLDTAELKEALGRFMLERGPRWAALVGPFERMAPLRNRVGQLQTIVMRIANLVAKADGQVRQEEVNQLEWIHAELQRQLEQVPLDSPGQHEAAKLAGRQAVQEMYADSAVVRSRSAVQQHPLRPAEVPKKSPEQLLAEALADLNDLIGLDAIKEEVRGLVNFLKMQREREKLGLAQTKISLHMVFSGNPGTGKTSVARLIGRIFGAMGILAKGHLVETDRSGLVAEYAGQTGPKTNKRIDEAIDGVLFIDEAYSMVAETGDDPYGAEAVQALLKRMEDDRDRLIVVLAGYTEPMDRLLKSNPGLSSRFNRMFAFPDYTTTELGRIFHSMAGKNQYNLPALTRVKLLLGFKYLLDHRDEHFGNGRLVRNIFERSIGCLANRITRIVPITKEILTTLESDDIFLDGVPAEILGSPNSETRRFRLSCPGCKHSTKFPQNLLACHVKCRQCGHRFVAEWGEVVSADEG